jgi:hypothetical protein
MIEMRKETPLWTTAQGAAAAMPLPDGTLAPRTRGGASDRGSRSSRSASCAPSAAGIAAATAATGTAIAATAAPAAAAATAAQPRGGAEGAAAHSGGERSKYAARDEDRDTSYDDPIYASDSFRLHCMKWVCSGAAGCPASEGLGRAGGLPRRDGPGPPAHTVPHRLRRTTRRHSDHKPPPPASPPHRLRVLPCSKRFQHDWVRCPFAHPGERRRCCAGGQQLPGQAPSPAPAWPRAVGLPPRLPARCFAPANLRPRPCERAHLVPLPQARRRGAAR